jgi:hypothetical protein
MVPLNVTMVPGWKPLPRMLTRLPGLPLEGMVAPIERGTESKSATVSPAVVTAKILLPNSSIANAPLTNLFCSLKRIHSTTWP